MNDKRRPGLRAALSVAAIILLNAGGGLGLAPAAAAQPTGGETAGAGPLGPAGQATVPGTRPPPRPPTNAPANGMAPSRPLSNAGATPAGPPPVSGPAPTPQVGSNTSQVSVTNAAPATNSVQPVDTVPAAPVTQDAAEPPAASPLPMILGGAGVALALLALGGVIVLFSQMSQRIRALQRALEASGKRREAVPAAQAGPGSFMLDEQLVRDMAPSQSLLPEARAQGAASHDDVARILGSEGAHQPVEVQAALVSLAHSVSDLIHHGLYAEERLELFGRGVDRLSRGDTSRTPEALTRLIDARIATAMGQGAPAPAPDPHPDPEPEPFPTASTHAPLPSRETLLWPCAERLFRRVGVGGYTEEIFDQALANKKAEILADGSYAQRPDLLRNNREAQSIVGVLRLAAGEWANRSDEITIPVAYKTAFADFISDYAEADDRFELIWVNAGESAKDSMHETSRIDGVRHEVVSGVRYPGLRSGSEVYMRAKVAIA